MLRASMKSCSDINYSDTHDWSKSVTGRGVRRVQDRKRAMPLFRQPEVRPEREKQKPRKRNEKIEGDEDEDEPSSLRRLCVVSLAENMKEVWTRDYVHNYMDQYFFRYVMGPFNLLRRYRDRPGIKSLCLSKQ